MIKDGIYAGKENEIGQKRGLGAVDFRTLIVIHIYA